MTCYIKITGALAKSPGQPKQTRFPLYLKHLHHISPRYHAGELCECVCLCMHTWFECACSISGLWTGIYERMYEKKCVCALEQIIDKNRLINSVKFDWLKYRCCCCWFTAGIYLMLSPHLIISMLLLILKVYTHWIYVCFEEICCYRAAGRTVRRDSVCNNIWRQTGCNSVEVKHNYPVQG